MGFKGQNIVVGGKEIKSDPPTLNIELTPKQVEFLLVTIKNSLFKGEYVEDLYNLTLKLQKHFIYLKSNNKK